MGCNSNCVECKIKGACHEKKYFTLTNSKINKIVAIISGKGGVGKSTVTSRLAVALAKAGKKVGILDADITGPSIPASFGVHTRLEGNEKIMYPAVSSLGIKMVSVNLLLDSENSPVVWRGPILGSAVKQFYSECQWGELDYLLIDMPPGTSDIQLTVLNNIPIDTSIIVTTPQDLVSMVVSKAISMVNSMKINILGIVENMSYLSCPCCGERIEVFGKSHLNQECEKYHLKPLAKLPIDPSLAKLVDDGKIEEYASHDFDMILSELELI